MTDEVFMVEVGPRDGLQNFPTILTLQQKIDFIQSLLDLGLSDIEAGSFVNPEKVPAMAQTNDIAQYFSESHDRLWYLIPNQRGLEDALTNQVTQLSFFTATSDTFNKKNIGVKTTESLKHIRSMVDFLQKEGYEFVSTWNQKPKKENQLKLRLYISTVIACPYEKAIDPQKTIDIIDEFLPLNISQVSLGDTIGVGTPNQWRQLLKLINPEFIQENKIAMHCHDTNGQALDCIDLGLQYGVRTFDASLYGLGGCPFAPGASGNLATEKLAQFLDEKNISSYPLIKVLETLEPKFDWMNL
jgi:hydroxymethylglutaryl-CoA lyase